MAHVYFTSAGTAYALPDGTATPFAITLPDPGDAAPVSPARRPVLIRYRKLVYNIGQYDHVIMADQAEVFRVAGLQSPTQTPVLANGTYAGGSEGEMIAYQTFARYLTIDGVLTKICESNPGPQSNTLSSSGQGRVTSNCDPTSLDAHATHTLLYISVDGEIPALAAIEPLSTFTGTFSENTLTAALGETLPVRVGYDGGIDLDIYARGTPPYTYYAEIFRDTCFYAGDPDHPERIYPSKIFEPEAVNTTPVTVYGRTEYPWLTTTDGQAVTGIKRVGDELIVGKPVGFDVITGVNGSWSIRPGSNHYGVISHFSMLVCGPLSALWFASQEGVCIYFAGTVRYVSPSLRSWWKDTYKLYPEIFEGCYAASNSIWGAYKLQFTNLYGGTFYILGDFEAAESGSPVWMFDFRSRLDYCQFELRNSSTEERRSLFTGSEDGIVREEDVMDDPDDDGDANQKTMIIEPPHRYPGGQEGSEAQANTFVGLDLFLVHEDNDVTVSIYSGDDKVAEAAVAPNWTVTSAATALPSNERQRVTPTSEHHTITRATGKGVTLLMEVVAPVGVEYRGYSIDYIPSGAQSRPFSE
jgi:hypothetical protein